MYNPIVRVGWRGGALGTADKGAAGGPPAEHGHTQRERANAQENATIRHKFASPLLPAYRNLQRILINLYKDRAPFHCCQ